MKVPGFLCEDWDFSAHMLYLYDREIKINTLLNENNLLFILPLVEIVTIMLPLHKIE